MLQHPESFAKNESGRYTHNSQQHIQIRQQIIQSQQQINSHIDSQLTEFEQLSNKEKKILVSLYEKVDAASGPFCLRLDQAMHATGVERKKYFFVTYTSPYLS
jgi:hypothetical protein